MKLIPALLLLCSSCFGQNDEKLANAFIQSIGKKDFTMLNPHIASADLLKKLYGNKGVTAKQIAEYKSKLKLNWGKCVQQAKEKNIVVNNIQIVDVFLGAVPNNTQMHGLNILYKYDTWFGMTGLIVLPQNNKLYILDIPNPTTVFTEKDSARVASEMQLMKDEKNPNIQSLVETKLNALIKYAQENDVSAFTNNIVWRGEDKSKNWKIARNSENEDDVIAGKQMLNKLNKTLNNCNEKKFKAFKLDRESEGVWYVYSYTCSNNKTTHFAFLKINNEFLLGDIDIESN